MAYPEHALVAICGDYGTTGDGAKEVWQIGVRVRTGGPVTGYLENPQQYSDDVAPLIRTWFLNAANKMSSTSRLTKVKVNNILPSGHYKDSTTHQTAITPATGPSLNVSPSMCCVAWSWETGMTTGTARRGRVYPPNITGNVFGTNSIDPASVAGHLASAKALLAILTRTESGGAHSVVFTTVCSRKDGTSNLITGVSVDTIIDVQRRRKNRVIGTRTTAAFP